MTVRIIARQIRRRRLRGRSGAASLGKDGLDREEAEARTREYMREMPAWRDHPKLKVVRAE